MTRAHRLGAEQITVPIIVNLVVEAKIVGIAEWR